MSSVYGTGFAHAGEAHFVRGPAAAFWSALRPVPLVLYIGGATSTVASNVADTGEAGVIRRIARGAAVVVSEWGGPTTFGNDTNRSRITEGIAAARANLNVTDDPVTIVGLSMGYGEAAAYALANPSEVKAIAGLIPGLDWNDLKANNRLGLAAALNAAYGGNYDDAVHGPTRSPIRFSNSPALPTKLWIADNDTVIPAAISSAYLAARPAIESQSLGAFGHTTAAITAAGEGISGWVLSQAAA